ncbi:MAG: septum formation initiator family protein [Prevotellaceae bacterium]|jgi:cell division protein FtsB|nr:septum formation initiator family protein [Prevotellaceae bacterium]
MRTKLLKYLKNKNLITIIIFFIWIIFFDEVTIPKWMKQQSDNNKIKKEIELFDKKTLELQKKIQILKTNKDSVEKFARENYYMKQDNEIIYIFD